MVSYRIEEIDISSLSKKEIQAKEHDTGRRVLSEILKSELGIEEYEIKIGPYGKPYLDKENVFFSIAHSGGFVLCAVSDKEIGADIETIAPLTKEKASDLAKRFFSPNELEYLSKNDFDPMCFYSIWTRKEAFSKCLGTPLMQNLSTNILENENIVTKISEKYVISIANI